MTQYVPDRLEAKKEFSPQTLRHGENAWGKSRTGNRHKSVHLSRSVVLQIRGLKQQKRKQSFSVSPCLRGKDYNIQKSVNHVASKRCSSRTAVDLPISFMIERTRARVSGSSCSRFR